MTLLRPISRVLVALALLASLTFVTATTASADPPTDSGTRLFPMPTAQSSIDSVIVSAPSESEIIYSDPVAHVVMVYSEDGGSVPIVGNGLPGIPVSGDAQNSPMMSPTGLAYDAVNDVLYIADSGAHMVVRVDGLSTDPENAQLSIVVGDGTPGSAAFGGSFPYAASSQVNGPRAVAFYDGMLFISDTGNDAIVLINMYGEMFQVVGPYAPFCDDLNGSTVQPSVSAPRGLLFDNDSLTLLIADSGNHRVTAWEPDLGDGSCSFTTIAGTGVNGSVTPGPATESNLSEPVSIDTFTGGILVADSGNHQILGIDPGGELSVLAGSGSTNPIDFDSLEDPLGPTGVSLGDISMVKAFGETILLIDATNNIFAYLGSASTPNAPIASTATSGNGSASIQFFPPDDLGGRAITKYQYTVDGGENWADADAGTTSPLTISGLTNGVAYIIKLRAVNAIGAGETSPTSAAVMPIGNPLAPTSLVATAGIGSASVSFTAGSDGGMSITKYQYQLGSGSWTDAAGTSSPITISGLTNGTSYSIKLRAVNSAGNGAASEAVLVTPSTRPSAPTLLIATAGVGSASIAFTPGADGGSAITKYQYRVGNGSWTDAVGTTSPITITGLTNYVSSEVRLRAVNAVGNSAASAVVSVIPRQAGPAVTSATPSGSKGIVVTFNLNPLPGTTVAWQSVVAYARGTNTVRGTCRTYGRQTTCYIGGLTSATDYDLRVSAHLPVLGKTWHHHTFEGSILQVRTNR